RAWASGRPPRPPTSTTRPCWASPSSPPSWWSSPTCWSTSSTVWWTRGSGTTDMADETRNIDPDLIDDTLPEQASGARRSKAWRRFTRNPLALAGLLLVVAFALTAIFAPVITELPRSCVRDLGLSASNQYDYKNPTKAAFWRAVIAPPQTCFN